MKKLILLITLLISVISFAQKSEEFKKEFLQRKKFADSLQIEYPDISEYVENIDILTDFKDFLLLNNNYKDKEKRSALIDKYEFVFSRKIYIPKTFSNEANILDFYDVEKSINYINATRVIGQKVQIYLDDEIEKIEYLLIKLLRDHNYPIEKFNKLSEDEKEVVMEKIDSGYIYP